MLTIASWVMGFFVALVFTLQYFPHLLWSHFIRHQCNMRLSYGIHLAFFSAPTFVAMKRGYVEAQIDSGIPWREAHATSSFIKHPCLPLGKIGCILFGHAWDFDAGKIERGACDCRRCSININLRDA